MRAVHTCGGRYWTPGEDQCQACDERRARNAARDIDLEADLLKHKELRRMFLKRLPDRLNLLAVFADADTHAKLVDLREELLPLVNHWSFK